VLSEVKWNYMRTRKRFLISQFPRDWRVVFFEPVSSTVGNNFRPRRDGNVVYLSTPVLKPHTESALYNRLIQMRWVRNLLGSLTAAWVRVAMLLLGVRSDVTVLISNVYFAPVVEGLPSSFVCYDCNDDPTVFPGVPEWSREGFLRLLRRADVVVACSDGLAARVSAACGKKAVVIGNGVDYDVFAREVAPSEIPEDIGRLRRPVVGYTGAIKEWFDFSLVGEVAAKVGDASVALIGPVAPGVRREAEELSRARPNVHFLGEKAYESLPAYLAAMSVCLIPFKEEPLTSVLNPNKLYEYFAAGKTVVSLAYSADMARHEGLIHLVRDRSRFAETVKVALAEKSDPAALRDAARRNSWASKSREMASLLERGRDRKSGGRAA
ncbi:MAG: glycosyltransferase, partial [Candidatus Eisenbacteria bacterium]|nr:glycosyltransferase [Candidatus Eisenbacteria bacterium]